MGSGDIILGVNGAKNVCIEHFLNYADNNSYIHFFDDDDIIAPFWQIHEYINSYNTDIIFNYSEPSEKYKNGYSFRDMFIRKNAIEKILSLRMIGMNKDDMVFWANMMNIAINLNLSISYNTIIDKDHPKHYYVYFQPLISDNKNYKNYDIHRLNAYIFNTEANIAFKYKNITGFNFVAPVNDVRAIPINYPVHFT